MEFIVCNLFGVMERKQKLASVVFTKISEQMNRPPPGLGVTLACNVWEVQSKITDSNCQAWKLHENLKYLRILLRAVNICTREVFLS